jgi:hypothetical protein
MAGSHRFCVFYKRDDRSRENPRYKHLYTRKGFPIRPQIWSVTFFASESRDGNREEKTAAQFKERFAHLGVPIPVVAAMLNQIGNNRNEYIKTISDR